MSNRGIGNSSPQRGLWGVESALILIAHPPQRALWGERERRQIIGSSGDGGAETPERIRHSGSGETECMR